MGRSPAAQALARTLFQSRSQPRASLSSPPWAARLTQLLPLARPLSSSCTRQASGSGFDSLRGAAADADRAPAKPSSMDGLANLLSSKASQLVESTLAAARNGSASASGLEDLDQMKRAVDDPMAEYHFNVYSHKHNTHITVSKPNRDVILSVSSGNLGFKKAQRNSYDAAYQLGAYVCDRLYQRGWHKKIQKMQVTLRGFGAGREAVSKILLGNEGRMLRQKITRVADATKLKFGGTRSKRPRRLG